MPPKKTVSIDSPRGTPRARPSLGARQSLGGRQGIGGRPSGGNDAIVIESQRFEEWMKIASDNKITSNNTWNLALIDYFHDMSLLRNRDDNSINFQKASCTLDGCVKIWTSRVDSVANETGKLLSGLSSSNDAMEEEEDVNGDSEDEDGEGKKTKKTKSSAAVSTLVTSFNKIKVKNFDLEFTVDPLFKKTSADFDEGGASGILMNHLGVDRNIRIVFDASDSRIESAENDNADDSMKDDTNNAMLDLTRLRARFLPHLRAIDSMSLCPSLKSFQFSSKDVISFDLDGDEAGVEAGLGDDIGDIMQDEPLPDLVDDNGEEYDFFETPNLVPPDDSQYPVDMVGDIEGFDPASHSGEHELVVDMDRSINNDAVMDYFNSAKMKNWAGPEHWKLRRLKLTVPVKEGEVAVKSRKEKERFTIDFSAPALSRKELFKPPTQAASIRMPKLATARQSSNTLPEDVHFTGSQLLRLFLKKKATVKMRRRLRGTAPASVGADISDAWAPADDAWAGDGGAPERFEVGGADFTEYAYGEESRRNDYDDMTGILPFTSAFSDDEDDPFFDAVGGDDVGDEDLLAATQGTLHRVRPEQVHYAKRAKRVDLKKLKDVIWGELEPVSIPVRELPNERTYVPDLESDSDARSDETPATPTSLADDDERPKHKEPRIKNRELLPVLTGIQKSYPDQRMDDISTSFCFICLLHLANEKNLQIQAPQLSSDGTQSVGGIDSLRVFKEIGP